ncbi:MAG: glycosyltransferase family 4 protein [Bacteroidetes bacterium]|nr:glycosyltransferase family 4 protein [Bacteroidota bacterium]
MNNNKKYILICQATRYLIVDILNVFAENGSEIELFTGEIRTANIPLNSQIKVKKLITYNNKTNLNRLITGLIFTLQCLFLLIFRSKKNEIIFITTPPFIIFLGVFCKKFFHQPYHLLIWDLYPDVLVNFNVIKKKGLLEKIWAGFNEKTFRNAANIITISDNMAEAIKNYSKSINVEVISNWVDSAFIVPLEKENNPFAIQYHQTDKLTVIYSGNLGETHDIETIVEVAKIINNKNISFLIIGEGAKKKKIEELIIRYKLDNVIMLPLQSSGILPKSLACADIGVITLSQGAENVSVPSKTYYMMAAGSAILALSDEKSEISRLVEKYEIGEMHPSANYKNIAMFINEMFNNKVKLKFYKQNSRKASFDFTPENAKKYYKIIHG